MGLLHLLEQFRLSPTKRSASFFDLPKEELSGNKKNRRRSIKELLVGKRTGGKETARVISMFATIHTHHKKSRMLLVTNGWFGRNVENFVSITSLDKDSHKDCPAPRSGHRIFATEDFIYLVGGYHPRGTPDKTFTDIWRFNILTEKWQKCSLVKGLMPDCLASFSLVQTVNPNEVYAFGGTGVPFGNAASNDLYKFYIKDNGEIQLHKSIVIGKEHQRPPRIYGQAMCFINSSTENNKAMQAIYLVGGTTGHEYNIDVWRLQLSNNSHKSEMSIWESTLLTSQTYHNENGRYRLEVIFYQNQLITFGGGAPDFCAEFNQLLTFDLKTETFVKLKTAADEKHGYPEGRKCHAIVEFHGQVYVIGGCRDVPMPRRECKMTNDMWKLDLAYMRWTKLNTSLPMPLFFHSAAVTSEGCVYVFGGCTDISSQSRTNKIFKVWLRPPSLRHLAMRAVKANSRKLIDNDMLLSLPNRVIRNLAFQERDGRLPVISSA